MQVVVNGQAAEYTPDTTVGGLVASHKFERQHVAVEVNGELVRRADYDSTLLHEGNQVEIVTLVGGG